MNPNNAPAPGRKCSDHRYRLVCHSPQWLTQHLMHHFSIPPGNELAVALSPDGRGDNERVIRGWVVTEMARIASGDQVDNLLVALEERLLERLQSAFPHSGGEVEVPSAVAMASNLRMPYWERTDHCRPQRPSPRDLRQRRPDWRSPDAERPEQRHDEP